MKSKFFSLVDYDALNLWLNIVASNQEKWTLDEATEFFGEELKIHLPRLLSSNFLSGNYSEFWIPSFPEFSQLILEETFMNITSTSSWKNGEPINTENFESKLRQCLESYEKRRISNYTNMRKSIEQSIKDASIELEYIFKDQFSTLKDTDGSIIPQLNPIEVLEYLQQLKINIKNTLNEFQEMTKLQIEELINKANKVYTNTLSKDSFGLSEENSFSDSTFKIFYDNLEKRFTSFNQRLVASTELFKLDVGKLSKGQIELINSLESIIGQIIEKSISNLGNNTSKILDYIFINLRQNLDSLTGNISKSVQESEMQSKEGIENLVSSVFTINRKVVEELIEALDILSQSASKMKSGLNSNLATIEKSISEQVESSVEQLEASVDDIKQIQETTYSKILSTSKKADESNRILFDEVIISIETAFTEIQSALQEQFARAKESFLTTTKLDSFIDESLTIFGESDEKLDDPIHSEFAKFIDHLDTEYIIIPRVKVASITPEASSFVNSNISSAKQVSEKIGVNEKISDSIQEVKDDLRTLHKNSISQLQHHHQELLTKTTDFIGTLGEYLNAQLSSTLKQITEFIKSRVTEMVDNSEILREELKNDLKMGFSFIYDSIDPINMRLMHFKEVETPEFFEISREKVIGIADVIASLISKIYTQATKNRDRLNDQIQMTEMILNNQIEALKVSVMTQISSIVTKNKNDLLGSIEIHRTQVSKDIENVRSYVSDVVQEELNTPVKEFGLQLSKIEESVLKMQQVSSIEIDTLRNELQALLRRLQSQVNGVNIDVASKIQDITDRGLDELSTLRISTNSDLQMNINEVETSLQLQISDLGSYLSTNLQEQVGKIQKLNSLAEGGLSHTVKNLLNQTQKRLEDLYTDSMALLNELQERNSISGLYGEITDLSDSLLSSVNAVDLSDVRMLIEALSHITGRKSIVI